MSVSSQKHRATILFEVSLVQLIPPFEVYNIAPFILPAHPLTRSFNKIPKSQFVPVPFWLDAAESVSLILDYITAYQMMHRSAKIKPGQRVLIHSASGGVGTALLQLGRLAGTMFFSICRTKSLSMRGMSTR